MIVYLLLLTFQTSGGTENKWEAYTDKEAAKFSIDRHKKQSEQYGDLAGIIAPRLVQHLLVKTEEVS